MGNKIATFTEQQLDDYQVSEWKIIKIKKNTQEQQYQTFGQAHYF